VVQATDEKMAEVSRLLTRRAVKNREDPALRSSAVLLLCYKKAGDYCVLFNKRTEKVEFNKGDICFPGGSKDPEDGDLITTALRETREEMGINPTDVTILGELDLTLGSPSSLMLVPFHLRITSLPARMRLLRCWKFHLHHFYPKRYYVKRRECFQMVKWTEDVHMYMVRTIFMVPQPESLPSLLILCEVRYD
jgi:8-oxo-dGTP pyrophosphatase MutT (NUDIX family)